MSARQIGAIIGVSTKGHDSDGIAASGGLSRPVCRMVPAATRTPFKED